MLPDSRLTVLRGGTHAVAVEQPNVVASAIAAPLS
jgi:hypothetical protein